MFESDVVDWDAAETLAAAARAKTQANESEVERLILGAHFADLYPSPAMIPGDKTLPGRERGMIYGGPGCPGVAEFAVAEYAVVMGVSPETAAKDIGQALSLRHRHPRTWAAVMARAATAWKARLIATECLPLSVEAAAIVDRKVAGIIDSVTSQQLKNIVKAAIWEADPEAARAKAEQKARERGVWISRSDDHGTTTMFIKAATGTILRLYATITQLADALAALGDTDTLDQRRAKATEILSEPALADKLLQVAQYLAAHPEATTHTPADDAATATTHATAGDDAAADAAAASDHAAADATDATDAVATDVVASANGAGQASTDQRTQTDQPAETAEAAEASLAEDDTEPEVTADGQLASDLFLADEPGTNTEADRDTPHPSQPGHPLDQRQSTRPPGQAGSTDVKELIYGMGAAGRHDLAAKLAAIKHATDTTTTDTNAGTPGTSSGIPGTGTNSGTTGIGTTGVGSGATRRRPGRTKLYVHLTDETLLAGGGITRVEGFGPALAPKLAELLGHDQIIVQPVIDLNEHINVNAYEIPQRLRERIKLAFPVEQFPYGPGETTNSTDLDHITPFDPTGPPGPPGQTNTLNLQPLRRISHRVKTHAPGWTVERIDDHTIEWTTPHGYKFRVDHTGTHLVAEPLLRPRIRLVGEAE